MHTDESAAVTVDSVIRRIADHEFYPIDNGFTVDPETGYDGVPDLENQDGRVRTLAVRDLIRIGQEDVEPLSETLAHADPHVRQIGAMALGILRAERAQTALEQRLRDDPDSVVRSHVAIALGQIGLPSDTLKRQAERDDSEDVRHQCAVALDRIEKGAPVEPEVAERFSELEPSDFARVQAGDPAPDFALEDTDGRSWQLADARGRTVVLIWIFADWCPVCHKEFHELIEAQDRFRSQGVDVFTLECHDRYRARVMTGQELHPSYWFAEHFPGSTPLDPYPDGIWWPHLIDRAAAVGLRYGVDPWAFTVHGEWVNRPSTVIVDPDGIVRLAYFGRFWGDRPTIGQTLEMIETGHYDFERPQLRRGPH